ncbi:MAG: DUF5668 domain-containing protein [Chloroflexota bacterium]
MSDDSKARRIGFPLGATILIVLGVVFLLNNLGYLPWGIWGTLWRFWPVLLILVGVNFFLAGSRPWLMLVVTIIVLAGVFFGAWVMVGSSASTKQTTVSFSQPLGSAERAEVQVDFGAGKLVVGSLPSGSDKLAVGEVSEGAVRDATVSGGVARLRLTMPSSGWWVPGAPSADWKVQLTRQVPLDLVFKTRANESEIDLTDLVVASFTLESGASRNLVILPANAGTTKAVIKAGAADIQVIAPSSVAVRIKAEAGISSVDIDQTRFPKSGDYYVSPDYATARNRIELELKAGAASITVR